MSCVKGIVVVGGQLAMTTWGGTGGGEWRCGRADSERQTEGLTVRLTPWTPWTFGRLAVKTGTFRDS